MRLQERRQQSCVQADQIRGRWPSRHKKLGELKMRKLFTVGILAVCSLTIASAKNYELTLSGVTKVGNIQLKPGQYTLKVTGTNAMFTNEETAKSFTTPVT